MLNYHTKKDTYTISEQFKSNEIRVNLQATKFHKDAFLWTTKYKDYY